MGTEVRRQIPHRRGLKVDIGPLVQPTFTSLVHLVSFEGQG